MTKDKPKNPVGRPVGSGRFKARIQAKLTEDQKARYLALGGSKWLRGVLDAMEIKKTK